jgi:hypothetical protein
MVVETEKFINKTLILQVNYSYLKFDFKHNWIKRMVSYDYPTGLGGKRSNTLTRKITYY